MNWAEKIAEQISDLIETLEEFKQRVEDCDADNLDEIDYINDEGIPDEIRSRSKTTADAIQGILDEAENEMESDD